MPSLWSFVLGAVKYNLSLVVRKPAFCICENKDANQLRSNCVFVFAIRIVQSLYYLNPKFQAFSHFLWLYSPVCVGPGSHNEAHLLALMLQCVIQCTIWRLYMTYVYCYI